MVLDAAAGAVHTEKGAASRREHDAGCCGPDGHAAGPLDGGGGRKDGEYVCAWEERGLVLCDGGGRDFDLWGKV